MHRIIIVLGAAICTLLVASAFVGCDGSRGDDSGGGLLDWEGGWMPQGKWGAEADFGGDADGDTDADGDMDGDLDADMDTDSDSDTDADTDSDVDAGYDAGSDAGDGGAKDDSPPPPPPEPTVLYLSADDSNSQSSPVLVRTMIQLGMLVPPANIRIWEFLNYYNFSYAPPDDKALSVVQQFRPYDVEEGLYALQIGVQGRHLAQSDRRPINVTLVLDTSGSMGGEPIARLKDVCNAIAGSLVDGDTVSMVTWDTSQAVVLDSHSVDGPDDATLLAAIAGLSSGGGTNLHGGLTAGYGLAETNFVPGGLNRVVLISDGGANAGITDEEIIAAAAEGAEGDEIYLVGVGVGDPGYYNDELMDTVTDWGKGASLYVDSKAEADKMFGDRFLATMEVTALDVQVEMTLPPYFEMDQFFGEEYSESPDEVEPQHLAPGDAMIYQQLIKTSQPDRVMADYTIDLNVTYTDALSGAAEVQSTSSTLQQLVDQPCDELRKGDSVVVYAQTLGYVQQLIAEDDYDAALEECTWGQSVVEESAAALGDSDLAEIAELLATYCVTVEAWAL